MVDPTSIVWWLNLVVSLVFTPLLGASVVAGTASQLQGRPVELGDALRAAVARWPASVGLYWVVKLAVGFGTCVLANWLVWVIVAPLLWVLPTATYFELIRVRGELPEDLVAETASVFD